MTDPFALNRFLNAQAGVYDQALLEIRRGAKRGHWMWFIFPQLAGLGASAMAQTYAIHSIEEARAYLTDPILGTRLRECILALQDVPTGTAESIFGPVDAMKLRSSLTLFICAGGGPLFVATLERWFGGKADTKTIGMLEKPD